MSPQYKGKFPMELNAHNYSQKAVMSQTDLMRKKNKKECLLKKKKKFQIPLGGNRLPCTMLYAKVK